MAIISAYDTEMIIWIDESGCDRRNSARKYGYSLKGLPARDHRIIARGKRYSAIPVLSMEGIHDVYLAEGSVDGVKFDKGVLASYSHALEWCESALSSGHGQCCNPLENNHCGVS